MTPETQTAVAATSLPSFEPTPGGFVAVNFIACIPGYRPRFEELFRSRAHAIDGAPGFQRMVVLKPEKEDGDYLVVSFWNDRAAFEHWRTSPEFAAGHRRGFEDVRVARERGEQPPMTSAMKLYDILCN